MSGFQYTLDSEPNYVFSFTDAPLIYDFKIGVSDEELDQVIKITSYCPFKKDSKNAVVKSDFYYNVPYGQGVVNQQEIFIELILQSFIFQNERLKPQKSATLIAPPTRNQIRDMLQR